MASGLVVQFVEHKQKVGILFSEGLAGKPGRGVSSRAIFSAFICNGVLSRGAFVCIVIFFSCCGLVEVMVGSRVGDVLWH